MTDIDIITMRAAFTSQALATMGADPEWDRRLSEFLRWNALQTADAEFGAYATANEAHTRTIINLEARFGAAYQSNPEGKALAREAFDENQAANQQWEQTYLKPFWQAACDLACTPAPTLAAALFKVSLIQWEDLGNDSQMPRDPMQIVAEDMARLAGEE